MLAWQLVPLLQFCRVTAHPADSGSVRAEAFRAQLFALRIEFSRWCGICVIFAKRGFLTKCIESGTSFGSVDGTKTEVLSKVSPVNQQRCLVSDDDGDAGEILFSSDDNGPFEAVTDTIHVAPTAPAALDTIPSFPDPGINGKSTEAWVAQFFAQSRLHYIGSWQQRSAKSP